MTVLGRCSKDKKLDKLIEGFQLANGTLISQPDSDDIQPLLLKTPDNYLILMYMSNRNDPTRQSYQIFITRSTEPQKGQDLPTFSTPVLFVTSSIPGTTRINLMLEPNTSNLLFIASVVNSNIPVSEGFFAYMFYNLNHPDMFITPGNAEVPVANTGGFTLTYKSTSNDAFGQLLTAYVNENNIIEMLFQKPDNSVAKGKIVKPVLGESLEPYVLTDVEQIKNNSIQPNSLVAYIPKKFSGASSSFLYANWSNNLNTKGRLFAGTDVLHSGSVTSFNQSLQESGLLVQHIDSSLLFAFSAATSPTSNQDLYVVTSHYPSELFNMAGNDGLSIEVENFVRPVYENISGMSNTRKTTMWNIYVNKSDPSSYCTVSPSNYYDQCIHAGEARTVSFPSINSCNGLIINDELNAFGWSCDTSKGYVTATTSKLNIGKGLRDLIDWSKTERNFLKNSVIVKKANETLGKSASSIWWSNRIYRNDLEPSTLNINGYDENQIFTLNTTFTNNVDIQISVTGGNYADGISLVTGPAGLISSTRAASPYPAEVSVSTTGGSYTSKFLWIEVITQKNIFNGAIRGISLSDFSQSVIHNTTVSDYTNDGLYITASSSDSISNKIKGFKASNNNRGILLQTATYTMGNTVLENITIANSNTFGISLSSANNRIIMANIYNSGNNGISVQNQRNTFINVKVTSSGSSAINTSGSNNTFINTTVQHTAGTALNFLGGGNSLLINSLAFNSTSYSLYLDGGSNHKILNFASFDPSSYNISTYSGSTFTFLGELRVKNLGVNHCEIEMVASDCSNLGGTGYTLSTNTNSTNLFETPTSDSSNSLFNSGNTSNLSNFTTASHWLNFSDNLYSIGIDANKKGRCIIGTGTDNCQLYSHKLSLATIQASGLACPTSGNNTVTHSYSSGTPLTVTFLKNAYEQMGDNIGNENGLCESNETCIYTPNFGAYQGAVNGGSPAATTSCISFGTGVGTISNVKLLEY